MVLVINVPKEIQVNNGEESNVYCGAEICNKILKSILKQSYNTFCLFNGTFANNLKQFQQKCDQNFDMALSEVKNQLKYFFNKVNIFITLFS